MKHAFKHIFITGQIQFAFPSLSIKIKKKKMILSNWKGTEKIFLNFGEKVKNFRSS